MNSAWLEYWAKTRTLGMPGFVLRRGTALGLIMVTLLVGLPRLFLMVESDHWPIVPIVVFILLGYALGYLLWLANERSYQKLIAQQADDERSKGPHSKDPHTKGPHKGDSADD